MEVESEKRGTEMREIVFIRHGTTSWNVEKRYLGHTDISLLPDAERELAPLRESIRGITWDALYCSDLLRCRQTVERIVPVQAGQAQYDPRLREIDFGQWEGMTYNELKDNPLYRNWIDAPQDVTPPGGEPWQAFAERIDSFVKECLVSVSSEEHSEEYHVPAIAVVTHGGVIRYAMSCLIPELGFWDTQVIPGQAMKVRLEKSGNIWISSRVSFP
ncbi:histidine phosphatase family protein [Paenibacillus illinoisensis]|uniref:Histidine phosphatase family protein n=1 Tax=Paenibacillus illinoisensis TaxID=59845 RepID=A0ABW8HRU2_9BACL